MPEKGWLFTHEVGLSSKRGDWETPPDLFHRLNAIFGFDLDVCASQENALCARYFTREQDAFRQKWRGTCWMNPPYGSDVERWVEVAWTAGLMGETVVALLPARTDTWWFHKYCNPAGPVFLKGRLSFLIGGQLIGRAPFPSMIVVFGPNKIDTSTWALGRYL